VKTETQQLIVQALERTMADLREWLKSLGVSEPDILDRFDAALLEKGLLASLLLGTASDVVEIKSHAPVQPETVRQELARLRSGNYADYLLTLPEPSPSELQSVLDAMKNALPALRHQFTQDAKLGPRFRKGGRSVEIPDPKRRREIREQIKQLRNAGSKLSDIFKRFADREDVSSSTIKRIWNEKDTMAQESPDNPVTKD
jgi:hypothetical protein